MKDDSALPDPEGVGVVLSNPLGDFSTPPDPEGVDMV